MGLASGTLRHRIVFQELHDVLDTSGNPIVDPGTGEKETDWLQVAEVWAAVNPLSARELLTAEQVQSQVTVRFVIRYRDGLNAGMRIVFRGSVYNIQGLIPDPDSGREWITIPASAGTNAG